MIKLNHLTIIIIRSDRHHCYTSGNILKTEGCQIYLIFVTVLPSPLHLTHKKRSCWSKTILQGVCSCLHPTTVLRHVVVKRLSPQQQRDGRNATFKKPIVSGLPYPQCTLLDLYASHACVMCLCGKVMTA